MADELPRRRLAGSTRRTHRPVPQCGEGGLFYDILQKELREQAESCASHEENDHEYLLGLLEGIEEKYCDYEAFHFGEAGIEVRYSHYTFGYCMMIATIPYEKVKGIFVPDVQP